LSWLGVEFRFGAPAETLEETGDGFTVRTRLDTYRTKRFINCAGTHADRIAHGNVIYPS